MLKRIIFNRVFSSTAIECRQLSSDSNHSALLSMLGSMWRDNKAPGPEHLHAIQNGASRCWELGNTKSQYVCIGGMGPMYFDDRVKVARMIDFKNKEFNKLHIEIFDCPTLLANKLLSTFPKLDLEADRLRIIKLSYHKYADQSKGRTDCLIVANHICKKLNDEGEFGFYSGAAIKNANNEIFFHNHKFLRTNNNEIHATVNRANGYLNINNLAENDVGVVYTDCNFDVAELRKWIESSDY